MKRYPDEEDYLMLSGVQHMAFCERQWALIHIEQQWQENKLTVEGKHLHEHADNPFENETRKEIMVTRGVAISSSSLGLRGISDVIEYVRDDTLPKNESIKLNSKQGRWKIVPVEYKRGKPKLNDADKVQLCSQAMCLEEMFNISIKEGYLYYNTPRRRLQVTFDNGLRERVEFLANRMHFLFKEGKVPKHTEEGYCKNCSLHDICEPRWNTNEYNIDKYLKTNLYSENGEVR